MIDVYSKFDNMHKNGMFYALIFINSHIILCIIFMLSTMFVGFVVLAIYVDDFS